MRSWFRRFTENTAGASAMIFALSLVPVMCFIGAAVDYSRASALKASLQQALDSAVLAAAQEPAAVRQDYARKFLAAELTTTSLSNVSFSTGADGSYSAAATTTMPVAFGKLLGVDSLAISASSRAVAVTASVSAGGPITCMLALDPLAESAFNDVGVTKVNAACRIVVNSSNAQAVTVNGSAQITSQENCIVGGTRLVGNGTMTPSPVACSAMADPFASVAGPTVGACTATNYQKSSFTGTVSPGVYCGGMKFTSSTVTFAPGTYIIKDGSLNLGSGTFKGTGVTFYFTGSNTSVSVGGNAKVSFSAPTTGSLASFIYFFDPRGSSAATSWITGTTQSYYEGVLYMPTQDVTMVGTSDTTGMSGFTAVIANTFHFAGNATITLAADAANTTVPVPAALQTSTSTSVVTYRLE